MSGPETNSVRDRILSKLSQAAPAPATAVAYHSPSRDSPVRFGKLPRFKNSLMSNEIRMNEVQDAAEAIPLIEGFLQQLGLNKRIKICKPLAGLDWHRHGIEAVTGTTAGDDPVSVSQAYAGIEDTGTLVLLTSPNNPTLLHFLPDHHIVLLSAQRVLSTKNELWKLMQLEQQKMPRALNFISGPSRTADIEQTIQLGAHGPRSLWLILHTIP